MNEVIKDSIEFLCQRIIEGKFSTDLRKEKQKILRLVMSQTPFLSVREVETEINKALLKELTRCHQMNKSKLY